jgi:hypothetical protein
MLSVLSKKMIEVLNQATYLEEEFGRSEEVVPSSIEVLGYDAIKKFTALKKEMVQFADKEISKINDLVSILAEGPDWLSNEDFKEILEDLRPVIGTLFSGLERVRSAGEAYLQVGNVVVELSFKNKLMEHCSKVKEGFGFLSLDLKKNLPYLSLLFTVVEKR